LYYRIVNEDRAVSALSALAHTQRLRVFRALVAAGPEGPMPSILADQLDVARNTLSFHLKELAHAGLVTVEQQGRNLIYRAHTLGNIPVFHEATPPAAACCAPASRSCC
jgi:DNA-binding transcriptional ArsR family regulator